MRSLAIVFLVVFFAAASNADNEEWEQYKVTHRKTYSSPHHERYRRKIFMDTLKQIRKHNFEADLGVHTWYMGVNQFSDMTDNEVGGAMTGPRQEPKQTENTKVHDFGNFKAPPSVNWVKEGYVNEVLNQGDCGSCYAFSAAGALEGAYKRAFKKLYKFSEQNIIDCTDHKNYWGSRQIRTNLKNLGCDGGTMSSCFNYAEAVKGLMLEKDYPYKAEVQNCTFKKNKAIEFSVERVERFYQSAGEESVRDAVALYGPAAAAFNSQATGFKNYRSGIINIPNCSRYTTHTVLIVGYFGHTNPNGMDYWLVKNSYGKGWGEDGYFKVARNAGNMCGICSDVEIPILKNK